MLIDTAIFLILLTIVGVILSVLFGGWIIFAIARGIFGIFDGPPRRPARPSHPALPERQCPRRGCLTPNPPEARFCRHCGTPLAAARRATSSRAACW